ncbi:DEKNAAC100032 [Brettanomyces naardenensis]|uniref:MICOS complex subunit MIC60 n=1 Tax=Brettanomyces naardenensis TaxID=13370 RepID=A0A448YEJ0_BRENA|nr:DEKNAAC100032 [Brettanomyces naardenensis]
MLRLGARRAIAKGSFRSTIRLGPRFASSESAAELKAPEHRRRSPLRAFWTIFRMGFYSFALYTAGATAALCSDKFEDYWVKYVPGGERYMEGLYDLWVNRDEVGDRIGNKVIDFAHDVGLEKYMKIPPKQEVGEWPTAHPPLPKYEKEKESDGRPEPKFENLPSTAGTTTKSLRKPLKKNVDAQAAAVQKAVVEAEKAFEAEKDELTKALKRKEEELKKILSSSEAVPSYSLNPIDLTSDDPGINVIVKSINGLISSLSSSISSEEAQKNVDAISADLVALSEKYDSLETELKKELQSAFAEEQIKLEKKYGEEYEKQSKELTEELAKALSDSKEEMSKKYEEKLKLDVAETTKTVLHEADNIIALVRAHSMDQLAKIVTSRVENERNGKLKNLDALVSRVEEIEAQEIELSKTAETLVTYKNINTSIGTIKQILASNESSALSGPALVKELTNLRQLTSPLHNELIDSALQSLPSDEVILTTGGVLTQSQLISRWELLTPELRKVSLLPSNAGVMGYISSFLFSKLLLPKSGVPVKSDDKIEGADVESVIARVNNFLVKNELDNAVEEVTNLKGWPRKLADDWLKEGRKKLEIQFLLDVVDTEMHVVV